MKIKVNNKYFRWGLTAFLVIASSIGFYYLVFHSSNISFGIKTVTGILMPVVFGLVIAYLLTPILNFVENRILIPLCEVCKIKASKKRKTIIRCMGIAIAAFFFYFLIYILIAMLLSQIVPSIMDIVDDFDLYVNNITNWINKLFEDNPKMRDNVLNLLDRYSGELEKWLNETVLQKTSAVLMTVSLSVINVLKVCWDFIIGFIISIYVLASKEKFTGQAKKMIYAIFNKNIANIVINDFRFTHKTFIGFISGKVLDSIIIGFLCFIGTSIMRTPYAALVSVTIGVTNIIPFFGPFLGAIPSTILIFIVDPYHPLNCVYFVIFILILQQIDGNIIGPKILGESTGLAGFWVIFAITLFGGLYGVLGMVIGVPIFAVILAALRSIVNALLYKKNLPIESKQYIDVCMIDETGIQTFTPEYKLKKKEQAKNSWFGEVFVCNHDEHNELCGKNNMTDVEENQEVQEDKN